MGNKNTYQIILYNQNATEIKTIQDIHTLDLKRAVNDIGTLTLVIPSWDLYSFVKPNSIISVSRSIDGGNLAVVGDTVFFVTGINRIRERRQKYLEITCVDTIGILDRRIIPYPAGSAYSAKTDFADDMCKVIMRENYGSLATGTNRTSSLLTIQSDLGAGPSISKSFAHKKVLTTLQDIAQQSYEEGEYLAFDIFASLQDFSLEFRTYTGQRGVDRRYSTLVQPITIDADLNIGDFSFMRDYSKQATFIYAAGRGQESNRTLATANDETRVYGDLGRVERFIDARGSTDAYVLAEAQSALRDGKPRKSFVGEFLQSENMRFGKEINYGDYLLLQVEKEILEVRIDAFGLKLNSDGKENVMVVLRSDS